MTPGLECLQTELQHFLYLSVAGEEVERVRGYDEVDGSWVSPSDVLEGPLMKGFVGIELASHLEHARTGVDSQVLAFPAQVAKIADQKTSSAAQVDQLGRVGAKDLWGYLVDHDEVGNVHDRNERVGQRI